MEEALAGIEVDPDADAAVPGADDMIASGVRAVANDVEISDHVGLVHRVARRYVGLGIEYDDLVQAGMMGALRAIKTYDPARGRFSTYATPWIRQSIVREIQNNSRTIRVPVHQQFSLYRSGKLTTEKLARLDAPLSDGDTTLYDFLGKTDDPTERLALSEAHERVLAAISELSDKQRAVVEWRFGEEELTLTEIGSRLGVSRARARQIEESALRALQRELKSPESAAERSTDDWDEPESSYWPQHGRE
jgi:RNA polymerase sigma factor (sigma-70 family)